MCFNNWLLQWCIILGQQNDKPASEFPIEPSVETLNTLFASALKPYKAIGDQIIYTPAKFKKLFGATADATLQGKFKVIKAQRCNNDWQWNQS